jgi:hypothetical protein
LTRLELPPEVTAVVREFRSERTDGQIVLNFHLGRIASMKITRHKRLDLTDAGVVHQNRTR